MYFVTDRYAAFWGYCPLDPISALCTISEGFSLVMVGVFWACLLRGVDLWKAYGVASIAVWKSTSELGYPENYCGDLCDPPRHRADAVVGTASHRPCGAPEI